MPKPIRAPLGGRIAARLHEAHYWPFKDKEFFRLINEADEDKLIELSYYASTADDALFKKKLDSLILATFKKEEVKE